MNPTRVGIAGLVTKDDLISAIRECVERARPGELAEWDADRLEATARDIRRKLRDAKEASRSSR